MTGHPCPSCGQAIDRVAAVCWVCGTPLPQGGDLEPPETGTPPKPGLSLLENVLLIIFGIFGAIALIGVITFFLFLVTCFGIMGIQ